MLVSQAALLLLVCLTFLSAQPVTRDQLTGTWVGVHTEWDSTYFCPLGAYMKLDVDSTYKLGLVDGAVPEQRATWATTDTSIRLGANQYKNGLIRLQNGLLRIGINYPMVFRRFTDIPIDSALTHQQLTGRVWQSDSVTLHLFANGRASWENRITRQRTVHFWRVARFEKSAFLVVMGNAHGPEGGYKPLWQVNRLGPTSLDAIGWNGQQVTVVPFRLLRRLTPADSAMTSGFQTCQTCYKAVLLDGGIGRGERRYSLLQTIARQYQPAGVANESGIVQVRFTVNCMGEKGLFSVQGWNTDYRPKTFDASITTQLIAICQKAIGNEPDDATEGNWQDKTYVLNYRLQHGQLINAW